MTTSDSEDFESADEDWDIQTDKLKDKEENFTSVKPRLELQTASNVSRSLEPGSDTSIKPNLEPEAGAAALPNVEPETDSDVRPKILNSRGDCTKKEVDDFVKSVKRDIKIEDSNFSAKATISSSKLPAEKCEEQIVRQLETHNLRDNNSVINDTKKPITHGNNDCVDQSEHVKSESIDKINPPAPELQTDGWDFEDEDLDDLVEENSKPDNLVEESGSKPNAISEESSSKPSDISEESGSKPNDISRESSKPNDISEESSSKLDDIVERSSNKPDLDSILNKLSKSVEKQESQSSDGGVGSGWGGWGVTSLLWTAAEGVSTLSNQVSQGLSTVLETGLGVPDPEELVKQEKEQEKKLLTFQKDGEEENAKKEEESTRLIGLGHVISGVSSISKLVETASSKVVSGGLDTLETIGKKTMEVLQEGDPGLRKKRAIFSEKVVLSQILREAKEKGEQEDTAVRNSEEARKIHFETLFDDYHGLVHLEALEMLSKQCNIKLQSVLLNTSPSDLPELQKSIADIKDICELPDEDEAEGESFETLEAKLANVGKGLGVPVANEKLVKTWQEIHQWIQTCGSGQSSTDKDSEDNDEKSIPTAQEIHQKAIGTLARLTAEAVEQFHKTAELLLVYEKRNPLEEANILLNMTTVFSLQVSTAATAFSVNLNTSPEYAANSDTINSQITNVFLEAANSSSYIQEAFQLLVPVLQVGVVST